MEDSNLYVDNNVLTEQNDGENAQSLELSLSPVQIQQEYFENLGDHDWIRYEKCNRNYLIQKLAYALYGPPTLEGELRPIRNNEEAHLEGYNSRQKEQIMKVYEKLCEQSKYASNNEDIVMSVLLIVCAKPKPLKFFQIQPSNYWVDLHVRNDVDIWCTAVFKVRKCIPTTVGAKACRIYIDENARVYNDWDSYMKNNVLPKCVLIVPEGGEYKGDIIEGEENYLVRLTVAPSPTLGLKARVLSTVDTASTVASLGAIGIVGATLFTPVAPAIIVGATVAGVATGLYGLVRSSIHLHDRSMHDQSISPTDAEARGSWLNIAASSVGMAAGAATGLLSKSAATGANLSKTGQALAASVEILRRANLVTGGAGVLNSLVHIVLKYRKHGEAPTKLELFQFTSATLFFCNAVVSNKTAQSIIEESQAKTINEYRATLRSNSHRKIFDKVSAEARRTQGHVQGNTEVIIGIKNIANKDQFFADVLRINKDINNHKLRISMTSDGQVNLNSQYKFNPGELRNLGKEGRTELFSTLENPPVMGRNVPTRLPTTSLAVVNQYKESQEEPNNALLVNIRPEEVIRVGAFLIRLSSSGVQNIAGLLQNLSQAVYSDLMTVSFNLLSKLLPDEIAKLRILSPDEDLIVQVVRFVFNYLKHKRPLGDPCRETDNGVAYILKEFFQDGLIRQETILYLKDRLVEWYENKIRQLHNQFPNRNHVICESCRGVRFA